MRENMQQTVRNMLSSEGLTSAKEFCLANAKTLALATGAAAALLYTTKALYTASKLPPGPIGVPILGRIPWLNMQHLEESHEEMRQKYGDIYSYRLGNRLMIVVSSRELLKEMLSEDVFSGRQIPPSVINHTKGCGILLTEGPIWAEQRRVSLRVLRDFGFARSESIECTKEEIRLLLEQIENAPNGVKTYTLFNALTNSVIAKIVFGRRYANEDLRYVQFLENTKQLFDVGLIAELPFLFPYLAKPLSLVPGVDRAIGAANNIQTFIEAEITQREALLTSDPDAEATCLCDAYIKERRRAEAKGDSNTFRSFQLVRVSMELFVVGTDTTAKTLEWLMVYMAAFPSVQSRVHEEVRRVIGTERQPNIFDKSELHYTQAVIDEAMRFSSLVANGVSHRALKDTIYRGYLIPSDAAIIPFVYGSLRDSRIWNRPNTFYPEHFLDADGRYAPSNLLIPFGIGKRVCPGESLAKLEVYLTFTAIMQRYRVQFSSGYEMNVDAILRGTCRSVRDAGENKIDFFRL